MRSFKFYLTTYIIICLIIVSFVAYYSYNNYLDYEEYMKDLNEEYNINATYGDVIVQHPNGTYEAITKDEYNEINNIEYTEKLYPVVDFNLTISNI